MNNQDENKYMISVIMSVHNAEDSISNSVKRLLKRMKILIFVIDDFSTDNTLKFLRYFENR